MINQPNLSKTLYVYTDGGCRPNPGVGGWAYCVLDENNILSKKYGGSKEKTTNNQMELWAIFQSLSDPFVVNSHIVIHSDSLWSLSVLTRKWKAKENLGLISQIWNLITVRKNQGLKTDFIHVRGHNGNKYNEYVDMLATKGRGN